MSALLVTGAALLGASAGWVAVPVGRSFVTVPAGDAPR
ncbi:prepilin peptidase, partial [Micromonospora chalcea]